MVFLFLVSTAITVFTLAAILILLVSGGEGVDARLMEIAARQRTASAPTLDTPKSGVARVAAILTGPFNPIRNLISGTDDDLAYRLTLAGFRKTEHVEMYSAAKMLLPVVGIVAGT